MDIDLSKLTVNELIELKKKIDVEQKTRDKYTEQYKAMYRELVDVFSKYVKEAGR